ncbi:MAG: hypothetical protein GWM90_34095, partial [Gemmatimonadetes bacterium]|nr:hypothetical protein [Gemmatimonadota bacterium]NIQ60386.1 hypothetical protein [Gemmatimonadota bacterium]NIU80603.1 hypothetical protein [Gammaproteobacteria bacterium]NIX48903.1 hypothetical protein [Gemmatimonadota bacterium]NIY13353.1 hypothetical protein [Gemmatimonadota bacterium]
MHRASRWLALSILLLAPLGCAEEGAETLLAPEDPAARVMDAPGLTVMSQNLYLGADLDLLLSGADPATILGGALQQLAQTNFPARAQALAAEI